LVNGFGEARSEARRAKVARHEGPRAGMGLVRRGSQPPPPARG